MCLLDVLTAKVITLCRVDFNRVRLWKLCEVREACARDGVWWLHGFFSLLNSSEGIISGFKGDDS